MLFPAELHHLLLLRRSRRSNRVCSTAICLVVSFRLPDKHRVDASARGESCKSDELEAAGKLQTACDRLAGGVLRVVHVDGAWRVAALAKASRVVSRVLRQETRPQSAIACVRLEADQGPQAIAEAGAEEINRAFRLFVEVDGTEGGTQLQAEPWVLAFRTFGTDTHDL